jgi:hypothetical protein
MRSISSRRSPAGRRCGAIFIVALVLAACNPSPDQDLRDKAGFAGSWAATLQMAGEKWIANSVPTSFVRTSCEAAIEDLDQAAGEAAKSKAQTEARDSLRRLISETAAASTGLRRAAEANDRPAAAQAVRRLAEIHRGFEALAKPGENGAP